MNNAPVMVMLDGSDICMRIVGRATFVQAQDLRVFIVSAVEAGYGTFRVDLAGCPSMDSTFMGVLAMMATRCGTVHVDLIHAGEKIRRSLTELGIVDLFTLCSIPCAQGQWVPLEKARPPYLAETANTVRDAHRTLGDLHSDNLERFRDILDAFTD